MFYKTIEDLTNEIDSYKENIQTTNKAKNDQEELYIVNEEKYQKLVELCDGLKTENNQLKTGYDKVGKDTQFFTSKLKEMMGMLQEGEKEKKELLDEMGGMTDLNNRMKEELDKKNTYLKNFAEGLETVKSNVE